jgi:GrpB-like predicted nucleotidyltransferase (UPF0157 family)
MVRKVEVVPHNPRWRDVFEMESNRKDNQFGIRTHHVHTLLVISH